MTPKKVGIGVAVFLVFVIVYGMQREPSTGSKDDRRDVFEIAEDQAGDNNRVRREILEDDLTRSILGDSPASDSQQPVAAKAPKAQAKPKSILNEDVSSEDDDWGFSEPVAAKEVKKGAPKQRLRSKESADPVQVPVEKTKVVYVNAAPSRRPESVPSSPANGPRFTMNDYLMDSETSSVTSQVMGSKNFAQGALLKNGSKYLGVIEEPLRVVEGEKQPVEIMVIGKLSPHSVSIPFLLTGEAELSKDKTRIHVKITHCVDPRSSAKSVECDGVVRDKYGYPGLGGEQSSRETKALVARVIGNIFAGMTLSSLTKSVTENGRIVDQTSSNFILEGVAAGGVTACENYAKKQEEKGESVTVEGPSMVQIRVTDDSELW